MAGQSSSMPQEKSALTKVIWYSIVEIAGMVAGGALFFYSFFSAFASAGFNIPPNATPSQISTALTPIFQNLGLLTASTLGIGLVGTFLLTMSIREFRKVDYSKFDVPWIFMLILIVGTVVALVGLVPLFNSIPSIIAQAPTTPSTPSTAFFSAIGALVGAAIIAAVGGILAVVGSIGGVILGLWRVGSRYDETVIKIGAIFTIIPLLNIVAPILILVGAYGVRGRLPKPM
jgi:uncharacterized protein DUF973